MNGIDNIIERIKADTEDEIKALEAETQKACEEITSGYEARRQDVYWARLRVGTKAAEQRLERLRGMAEMEAKKQLLALRQEMVAMAFDLAVKRLSTLPEDEYVELLAGFAKKGARSGTEQIILSPADRTRYGKKICARANALLEETGGRGGLTLSESTRGMQGGLILTDGSVDINYSLETLVSLHRNALMERVSGILFE